MHVAASNKTARVFDIMMCLPDLRVDFLEVVFLDENLTRFATGGRGDQAVGFHHVHQPRGAAETDSQASLQVRDRRLP
jgi:hypothetical protein